MRGLRILAQDVWYEVRTSVNNGEPLFWSKPNRDLFRQVLYEARQIYGFELRGLRFSGPEVSFYIRPADGFQLPEIMQWIKQTFAARFNVIDGRTGHIWGDRYWSVILVGDTGRGAAGGCEGVCVCPGGVRAEGVEAHSGGRRRRRKRGGPACKPAPGTRGTDPGRDGGRLSALCGPVYPASPPPRTANRPG
jgi:hypothetical protein